MYNKKRTCWKFSKLLTVVIMQQNNLAQNATHTRCAPPHLLLGYVARNTRLLRNRKNYHVDIVMYISNMYDYWKHKIRRALTNGFTLSNHEPISTISVSTKRNKKCNPFSKKLWNKQKFGTSTSLIRALSSKITFIVDDPVND